jgi:molecular chaperone DnaK
MVARRVEEYFHRPSAGKVNPDEVVAQGAAVQAAALTKATAKAPVEKTSRGGRTMSGAGHAAVNPRAAAPPAPPAPSAGAAEPEPESGRTMQGPAVAPSHPYATAGQGPPGPTPVGKVPLVKQRVPAPGTSRGKGPAGDERAGAGVDNELRHFMREVDAPAAKAPAAPSASRMEAEVPSFEFELELPPPSRVANPSAAASAVSSLPDGRHVIRPMRGAPPPPPPFVPRAEPQQAVEPMVFPPLPAALPPLPPLQPLEPLAPLAPFGAAPVAHDDPFGGSLPGPDASPAPFQPLPQIEPSRAAPLLIDVTPISLGVEVAGGFCDFLIRANTPVPCDRTRVFRTASDNQVAVRVRVVQGESQHFSENTYLGDLELSGLRAAPRGEVQVGVTFEIDADGILNVRAKDESSGRETIARMNLLGAQTDADEVEAMMARQRKHEVA